MILYRPIYLLHALAFSAVIVAMTIFQVRSLRDVHGLACYLALCAGVFLAILVGREEG